MKKIVCFALILIAAINSFAQDDVIKSHSFGFQISFIDFPTAQELRSLPLNKVIDNNGWKKTSRMEPALTLTYLNGLDSRIDFMARLTASFLRYPFRNSTNLVADDKFYTEADVNVNVKLLSDRYIVVPYVQAGIGAAQTQKTYIAQVPLGVGLQVKIGKNNFINLNSNYRVPVTAPANYSLLHSIGMISGIVNEKPKPKPLPVPPPPPPPPPPPADTDGDGVVDSLDLCRTVPGLASFKGCPDTDKDGIQDSEDKCPNEAGVAKYNGCPVPDTDKDGLNDEQDKCPELAGVERYEGCPVPDTDKDGLNDEEDRCPAQSGTAEEMGCPAVIYKPVNIQFGPGSSVLSAASKKELNLLSKYLIDNPGIKVYLLGHTDTSGNPEKNVILSIERAQKTAEYLALKGVEAERLNTEGVSSKRPIAPNKASKGREINRRVEVILKRY